MKLRDRLAVQSGEQCGYCQAKEEFIGMPLHIEHIIPRIAGGPSTEENLWLACSSCNLHKGSRIYARDSQTGRRVQLFNPRKQHWKRHFEWLEDGTVIRGKTACGRATVEALQMNNSLLVNARRRWRLAGWNPME
jgi:hypothetical protein